MLSLVNVSRRYAGGVLALNDVSVSVMSGEFTAIVGPSGSGKSTMLNLAGTLDRPSSGQVLVHGIDVATLSDRQLSALRARYIGFVFQQFHLAPGVSTLDNVADGLLYTGVTRRQRRARAAEALDRVGLAHRLRHRPHELSGGERQRTAIARAIVADPELLLADEPTGNLDSVAGAGIMQVLSELNADGATVLMITHDRELAAGAPRQIVMRDGRVVTDGHVATAAVALS